MSKLTIGRKVADFTAQATGGDDVTLSDHRGENVVLYFYPKDNTPGCTTEGQDFRDAYRKFRARNTVIYGVSRDSLKSHEGFKEKQKFPFELISDPDGDLCRQFDVIKDKSLYGRKFKGIERSTFLIDEQGVLRREWRKLKVGGHVEEVLQAVKDL